MIIVTSNTLKLDHQKQGGKNPEKLNTLKRDFMNISVLLASIYSMHMPWPQRAERNIRSQGTAVYLRAWAAKWVLGPEPTPSGRSVRLVTATISSWGMFLVCVCVCVYMSVICVSDNYILLSDPSHVDHFLMSLQIILKSINFTQSVLQEQVFLPQCHTYWHCHSHSFPGLRHILRVTSPSSPSSSLRDTEAGFRFYLCEPGC